MTLDAGDLQRDLVTLTSRDFFYKYILRSDNWYFENIIGATKEDSIKLTDDLKAIISQKLKISYHNIAIVGSSKVGFSLSPDTEKTFRKFNEEISDIDIAIISDKLFQTYWDVFRKSYSDLNKRHYRFISRGIYRGYINEKYLNIIAECRKTWNSLAVDSKKVLRRDLYIKPEITYRIYRSWEDFEDYHIGSIDEVKKTLQ